MKRKSLVLPAVVGLLAPVLAACGGPDSAGAAATRSSSGPRTGSSVQGGPGPARPRPAYDVGSWNVLRNTFQTLMVMPRSASGEPVPEAAQRCGFTDTGNAQYRCTLRTGLKFANGTPLTAEDVKFSLDRMLRIEAAAARSLAALHRRPVETHGARRSSSTSGARRDLPVQAGHPGRGHP